METFRIEHDLLGERLVPNTAYYGIQTMRAMENFMISEATLDDYPELIAALAYIKKACAQSNLDYRRLPADLGKVIMQASDKVIDGAYDIHFPIDMIQGGAGTSTNMNANEVIANLGLELLGKQKGEYQHLHPNTHVNMSQSTNDVYPTAVRLAAAWMLDSLIAETERLSAALALKAEEFADVLKMGRTQLQDAVPMSLGQEFSAYAAMVGDEVAKLKTVQKQLYTINMGATAIGTGITAPKNFGGVVTAYLAVMTELPLTLAPNLVQATQDSSDLVEVSTTLKRLAIKVSKICNDLRLLSSGPRTGIGEINLPPMQPGSSIMPGKVNPVIPEVVNQVAFEVIGNDVIISIASEAGQLELNVMEPVLAYKLFESIRHFSRALATLTDQCVVGITANREHARALLESSIGLVTALVPHLGYEIATEIAKKAQAEGSSVAAIVLADGHLSEEELERLLTVEELI